MYVCCVSLYTVMSLSCCTIFSCLLFFFLFFLWIVIFSIICFSFKSIHFCKKKKKLLLLICIFIFILHFTQFPYRSSLPRLCLYSKARQQSFPSYPVVCVWLPAADFSSLSSGAIQLGARVAAGPPWITETLMAEYQTRNSSFPWPTAPFTQTLPLPGTGSTCMVLMKGVRWGLCLALMKSEALSE